MQNIALCVPVFIRREKLRSLLESAEDVGIESVYVADDGSETLEQTVYHEDYSFDLTVFDLEYDAGIGYKRQQLVERTDEPYLLIVDNDMQISRSVQTLVEQLESRPHFGGVTPMYLEKGRIWTASTDLYEERGMLYKDIREEKSIKMVSGSPYVRFDFVPNVGMFRREAVEDYCWDPEYTIQREHIDFYVGHWKHTDWEFGLSPSVYFQHNPGGNSVYMSERHSQTKKDASKEYFNEKWGYDGLRSPVTAWVDSYSSQIYDFPPPSP